MLDNSIIIKLKTRRDYYIVDFASFLYEMPNIKVCVLWQGYSNHIDSKADGSVTLIKTDSQNILVDTGLPCHKNKLISALMLEDISPCNIQTVIGTHGHSDHIGNLNLFDNDPLLIVGYDISRRDIYYQNKLSLGEVYNICDGVYIMPTSGHTCSDVSVVVEDTTDGTVVVVGDLFEHEDDISDESIWLKNSFDNHLQRKNRLKIANIADRIIPGHGPAFNMTDEYRVKLKEQI